jgi:hypothetical protein
MVPIKYRHRGRTNPERLEEIMKKEIQKYLKTGGFKMRIKEEIKRLDNFPIDGESYILGLAEDNRYFFAWGSEIPYSEEIPNENILDGENGIEFFNTLEEAENRFNITIDAWEV